MRASSSLALTLAALALASCDGCDVGALEALHAELALSPGEADAVAWVGYDVAVPFVVENRGRAFLDVTSATVDGVTAALTTDVIFDGAGSARVAPGGRQRVDVVVHGAAPGAVELL